MSFYRKKDRVGINNKIEESTLELRFDQFIIKELEKRGLACYRCALARSEFGSYQFEGVANAASDTGQLLTASTGNNGQSGWYFARSFNNVICSEVFSENNSDKSVVTAVSTSNTCVILYL